MSEKFELNEKFWALDGVLGRRGFIVNFLIIQVISAVFITPFIYLFIVKPELMTDIFIHNGSGNPFLLSMYWIFILVCLLVECILLFPSLVRRVRDITADDDNNRIMMISSVLITLIFILNTPIASSIPLLNWIALFLIIYLMIMQGKITSEKPASELIKFNWGAFLGTWYWGIYNKVPKTLIMIPLLFVSYAWFPFMILCGLKGNEWAREKNSEKSIEDFHNAQKAQSIAFIFISPLLSILIFLLVIFSLSVSAIKYAKAHPDLKTKVEALTDRYLDVSIKTYFSKVELGTDESRFYMDPKIWVNLSEQSKRQAFDAAISYVERQEELAKSDEKSQQIVQTDNKGSSSGENENSTTVSKYTTAAKIRILSSFNNEVLASYEFDRKAFAELFNNLERRSSFKEYYEFQKKSYKFNNHPTLP